ncbi:hypothetical protein H2201_002491 [Coniosporium apollinis]|uniref:RING-type domain-containing protein n=1 Tax=Coniosporium apollinis TaxID=61459 RepID=A0ABQ9NY35_9PEZI|nr:hypothetical protein H2201_002491 [Coniosporium apollinis]
MSGYEVEHNIPTSTPKPEQPPRRPDLSTFFSTLELVDTSGERTPQFNAHALPTPENVAAAYRLLANAFEMMRGGGGEAQDSSNDLLSTLVQSLMQSADDPPDKVQGVPDSFLDQLERVPKAALREKDSCPICGNLFLDDKYPLVVELPCHKDHRFDLECIRPWLKLNPTCPLDRKVLLKKKEEPPPQAHDDDEGEYDDMYA